VIPRIFPKVKVREHGKLEGAIALERDTRFAWIWVEGSLLVWVQLELLFALLLNNCTVKGKHHKHSMTHVWKVLQRHLCIGR